MHKKKNVILLVVLAVFVVGIGWFISRERRSFTRHQFRGQAQVWYCPMHPWIKSDKPGVCPICGMALVPWHSHNQEATTGLQQEYQVMYRLKYLNKDNN